MPDFVLFDSELKRVSGKDLHGARAFVTVPSVDTGVCDLELKRFQKEASSLSQVTVYAVSVDLPFAQKRWCGANGADAIHTLSDYYDRSFGHVTGTLVEELALLARAVFAVDAGGKLAYVEYVPEITQHPDYEAVFAALEKLEKA